MWAGDKLGPASNLSGILQSDAFFASVSALVKVKATIKSSVSGKVPPTPKVLPRSPPIGPLSQWRGTKNVEGNPYLEPYHDPSPQRG